MTKESKQLPKKEFKLDFLDILNIILDPENNSSRHDGIFSSKLAHLSFQNGSLLKMWSGVLKFTNESVLGVMHHH